MNILITETTDGEPEYFTARLPAHDVMCASRPLQEMHDSEVELIEAVSVFLGSKLDREALDRMPLLRVIATRSTGFDHIDIEEATNRGIAVYNVPEYGSTTVAEHTFALILSLTRKVHKAYVHTMMGEFQLGGLLGTDLAGKTLGVIGLGKIGRQVARIGNGFELTVLATDPVAKEVADYIHLVDLNTLLQRADVITVCCPLIESTYHLIGEDAFRHVKPSAILVNTARGPIVDTRALLIALAEGRLAGAGLDVLEGEAMMTEDAILARLALPAGEEVESIARNLALMRHPNLIVTPHMAFFSKEALERIRQTTVQNLSQEGVVASANRVN